MTSSRLTSPCPPGRVRALHVAATLIVLAAVLLLAPAAVGAAEPAGPSKLPTSVAGGTLSMSATEQWDGSVSLEARLVDAAASPISGATVDFFVAVEYFGERRIDLGSVATDVIGIARLQYRPTWSGAHRLAARVSGADGSRLTSPEAIQTVSGVTRPIGVQEEVLPITRTWAMPVAVLVVAGVWLTLAAIFIAVVIGVRRAAQPAAGVSQRTLGQPLPARAPGDQ